MENNGLLITNGFLKSDKFDALYLALSGRAVKHGLSLERRTNVALMTDAAYNVPLSQEKLPGFAIFWDKDVRLARLLEKRGMRLYNSAAAVETCDDKALTHIALSGVVPMPKTVLIPLTFPRVGYTDETFLDQIADYLGFPFVLKECFGSFGQQVYLFHDLEPLRAKVVALAGTPMLFQQMVAESYGRDVRINVVGNRAVASILRQSTDGDFRSNLTLGGAMQAYTPTREEEALALTAVDALGLTFAGVDVLFGREGPLLCEVNSNAHFKTTLAATGVNMAAELLREIAAQLEVRP